MPLNSRTWQQISPEVVRLYKKCCVYMMKWMMRKKWGMLAVNMRQDRNCEYNEVETCDKNGEQRLVKLNKG
jgi:hypothetical protein